MCYYRLVTWSDVMRLIKLSGLEQFPWPPERDAEKFAYWLFAQKSPSTVRTEDLTEFVDEYVALGHDQIDEEDARSTRDALKSLNDYVAGVGRAVRRIRTDVRGDEVIEAIARLATDAVAGHVLSELDPELLMPILEGLETLSKAFSHYYHFPANCYQRGLSDTGDWLVVSHILRLDEHLRREPPVDGIGEYYDAEFRALGSLVARQQVRSAIVEAHMAFRIQASADSLGASGGKAPERRRVSV